MYTRSVYSKIKIMMHTTIMAPTYRNSHSSFARARSVTRFICPRIKISAPSSTPTIPAMSSTCGGLRIFTSRP